MFNKLMAELQQTRREMDEKITSSMAEVKREVSYAQERMAKDFSQKLNRTTYQFHKKRNEKQYTFNSGVEESIVLAQQELERMASSVDDGGKESLRKAADHLEEGASTLKTRQKHIKVADRLDYGWGAVHHYQSDLLADNSDDEKQLRRADKEAKKDFEELEAFNRKTARGGSWGGRRGRCYNPYKHYDSWADGPGPSVRRDAPPPTPRPLMSLGPQRQTRQKVLGPCFTCGGFGHLARTCHYKGRQYPFNLPVVSSADTTCVTAESRQMSMSMQGVDNCIDEFVDNCMFESDVPIEGVNRLQSTDEVGGLSDTGRPDSVDNCELHNLTKFWEVEDTLAEVPVQVLDVQGKLKQNISFWHEVLQAPPPIIDCIENGYRLPLKFVPPPYSQQNHKSVELYSEFVNDAIQKLIANRCVMKVEAKPEVCSPLSVVGNPQGKLRLVLNLRYLNQFLHILSFKYEDLHIAALIFEQGEYLFKFDLKSGYHHVDVWPGHYQFLGFRWDMNGIGNYYVFKVLPFGLSTTCYFFTKLMRLLVKYWRGRGLKAMVYLGDGIVAVKGEVEAKFESRKVKQDLEKAGFIVNIEKCVWEPSHSIEWLGFHIDLALGEFSVPIPKIDALKSKLLEAKHARFLPAKQLAGKNMSMSPSLGPVAHLMTRSLYATLNGRMSWCHRLTLTEEALLEIEFWHSEISSFNGQHIWPRPSAVRVVYSDASSTGYGGYVVEHGNLIANGQ